jgi:ADP-ribose pyrophosphatase
LEKTACYEGFFRLERYRLRHELFSGGWGEGLVRELLWSGAMRREFCCTTRYRTAWCWSSSSGIGALATRGGPWLLEVVAGITETGEDPAEVARREAVEEAGCEVQDLVYITEFVLSPGGSSETLRACMETLQLIDF